ncbi:UNVERIFIED_ORG: flagellin [Idiomarina abyssalis]|uniref:Flagellin n=2 Tax=Idiomarinaceae TaxID=267893 RepID=Q5QZT0_IDILO|nr:flagellin [Idiomarina loihiensis]AAV81976.1 Flagellin [Idiomarina loihiensis L2TR]AGM36006.1 flagellin [Idiomarina loihiensis GSL 199]MAA62319.1 flagellin [Idiomarina sp.]TDO53029.1 flagellin [Idiomarina sp. 017G]
MPLYVNTNVSSLNAQRQLISSGNSLDQAFQRLSSGFRINSAADDAAGLQISNRLSSQVNGLNQGNRNANDAISMAQTAEGALDESTTILQRMRTLSIQSANGSNSDVDRGALQKEIGNLQQELTRIAETTSFGGKNLLDGSFGTEKYQVGANANETISVSLRDVASNAIGNNKVTGAGTTLGTQTAAAQADFTVGLTAGDITLGGPDGNAVIGVTATDKAMDIVSKVNGAGTGVTASTEVEAKITNFQSTDVGTLSIGDESFDLAKYNGSLTKLSEDLGKAGIDATVDNGELTINAEDVNGVQITGGVAGNTVTLAGATGAGVAVDGTNTSVVVDAELQLESRDAFSITNDGTADEAEIFGASASTLSQVGQIDISTYDGSQDALGTIDAAIAQIDAQRADLGAVQNRFQSTIRNQSNIAENLEGAKSRIKDADFAAETAKLTQAQILQQASQTILAQANQRPQAALQLLG